jgi:hypothetical protein
MSDAWSHQLVANAAALAKVGICIGFGSWAIRGRYELDLPTDASTRLVRWATVLICWGLASLPTHGFSFLRAGAMILGYAALWWPNSVIHVMRRLRGKNGDEEAAVGVAQTSESGDGPRSNAGA